VASLYSIHNMAYQGIYPRSTMSLAGFGFEHFYPMSPFEFHGRVNLMKAGIVFADEISTVSERYALEIRSHSEYGHGLEGVLAERRSALSGIVNGIDDVSWNPETDPLIPAHFTADDIAEKRLDKQALLETFGFSDRAADLPLIGMVSRLVSQKGLDLVTEAIDILVKMDVRFVFLGTGDIVYHRALQQAAAMYPDRIAVRLAFDNKLAHQIVAGSDMFLMPSQYEPCGLSQLYSLRYGTIPIVRGTGGLVDTVRDIEGDPDGGTGFVFHDYTSGAMLAAIERALAVYDVRTKWEDIMRCGMAKDFSWRTSAEKYQVLYQRAIGHRS
jgi:starch synthase